MSTSDLMSICVSTAAVGSMDPELLEKAIIDRKEKTGKYPKAIVPVALYGMPYKIDEIMAIADVTVHFSARLAEKYNLPFLRPSEQAAKPSGLRNLIRKQYG